jgi:poly(3-hydroxybutyrate) depolymerase
MGQAIFRGYDRDTLNREYNNRAKVPNAAEARIFVSGHSAGGHLVAMLMASDWRPSTGCPPTRSRRAAGSAGSTTSSRSGSAT